MKTLDEMRRLYGGYWRYPVRDFHYLFNHYFPPRELVARLQEELPMLIDHYPSSQRTVAELLAGWSDAPWFTADHLVVGNGSSELIRLLNMLVTSATVPIPTFNEYARLPEHKRQFFYLREEERFAIDFDDLERAAKANGSDHVILCNPNNPLGSIVPREGIVRLLEAGFKVVVDEAFIDFDREFSAEGLVADFENLVIITTCTKSMGLAGLRLGYLLTRDQALLRDLREMLPIWNVNSVAERFIELFPAYRDAYLDSLARTAADRGWMFEALRGISYLDPWPSHANFVFCRCAISARKVAEHLYDEHKMLIKDGLNQAELKSDSYVRIGLKGREDNEALVAALRELEGDR